jgi:hypothetical protein
MNEDETRKVVEIPDDEEIEITQGYPANAVPGVTIPLEDVEPRIEPDETGQGAYVYLGDEENTVLHMSNAMVERIYEKMGVAELKAQVGDEVNAELKGDDEG